MRIINEELEGSLGKYKERIEAIDREAAQWEGRLERLYDFVETRSIEPVRMAKRIAEVQDKVNEMRKARFEVEEDIRRRRLEPLDADVVVKYVNDLKKFLESSNIFERRAFLGTFIESLEVDDGEITFNYGLPPDGAKQETVSVLGIVQAHLPSKNQPGLNPPSRGEGGQSRPLHVQIILTFPPRV